MVREKKTLKRVFEQLPWEFSVPPEQIFDFFKNPPSVDYKLKFREPSEAAVKSFLCDEHDFSEERIGNALSKLTEKKNNQKSLSRWIR